MSNAPSSKYEETLNKFRENYIKTLPEKFESIDKLISKLQQEASEETLKDLRIQIHKIAGSSGTYGFGEVSVYCKAFEEEILLRLQELQNSKGAPAKWSDSFVDHFEKIKKGFLNG